MLLGVEYLMRDFILVEQARQVLRGFNRNRTNQRRLPALMTILDIRDDCRVLLAAGAVHLIAHVVANHRMVCGYHDHFEPVNLMKLERFGVRRAGHSRKLLVEPEVILEGDGCKRVVFVLDRHAFLRLDRLV